MEHKHNNIILLCSIVMFAFLQIALLILLIINTPSREERLEIHKQALTVFFEENVEGIYETE